MQTCWLEGIFSHYLVQLPAESRFNYIHLLKAVHSSCEHLQEWNLHSLSGHPAILPNGPHVFFLIFSWNIHLRNIEYHVTLLLKV